MESLKCWAMNITAVGVTRREKDPDKEKVDNRYPNELGNLVYWGQNE